MPLLPIQSDILPVAHGFFTRHGGVSEGIYAGLNCGAGSRDQAQHVLENRKRVQAYFSADALCTLYQEHTAEVVMVSEDFQQYHAPKADAMVTAQPGLALGILTADCAPVLFYDPTQKIVGAAHAGWKGAVGGIIANTVQAMSDLGANPANIRAAIGPCIAQESYQVDMVFHASVVARNPDFEVFFVHDTERSGHYRFDLKRLVAYQLQQAGVSQYEILPQNTYTEEADFFSYRRTTHRQEPDYGRQISVIML